jgi:signal recognition particle receptor subunit beta
MLSLATETDRTLFFDFLPIELGTIRGMKTRVQLYTVPGQVFYNATRRMVLKGADCVVFVCDSQEPMLEANVESFENMRQNLEANEIDANEIPIVLQYNKRDLPNALPSEIMNERLNPKGLPFFEAVALKGVGVEETLKGATALVFRSLATRYGGPNPPGKTGDGPGTKPPLAAPGTTGPVSRPQPAAAPVAAAPARAAASAAVRPPAAATATLPPTPGAEEDALESLDLQPDGDEELSLEVDDSEVLDNTNPTPRTRPGQDTVARSGAEVDDLREQLRQPRSAVRFEPVEEDVEEIALEAPEPEPAPAPKPRPPAPATRPRVADAPRPAPEPLTPPPAANPIPVAVDLKPGAPAEAQVMIPLELTINGRRTPVHVMVKLVLDLTIPKR